MNWRYTAEWMPTNRWGYVVDWMFVPGYYRLMVNGRGFYIAKGGGWHIRYISSKWRNIK